MPIASRYVLLEIERALLSEDFVALEDTVEKCKSRYSEDVKLIELCDDILEFLKGEKDELALKGLKRKLYELMEERFVSVSGGYDLWFIRRRWPRTP